MAERRVIQGGRAKAYRPLPAVERRRALDAGLDAYDRGDFFLAHELLEPAWMGTADLPERELLQGVIKVAAAYVHAVRGNAAGVRKNLEGARARLAAAVPAGPGAGLDPVALVAAIDERLSGTISVGDEPIAIERRPRWRERGARGEARSAQERQPGPATASGRGNSG